LDSKKKNSFNTKHPSAFTQAGNANRNTIAKIIKKKNFSPSTKIAKKKKQDFACN